VPQGWLTVVGRAQSARERVRLPVALARLVGVRAVVDKPRLQADQLGDVGSEVLDQLQHYASEVGDGPVLVRGGPFPPAGKPPGICRGGVVSRGNLTAGRCRAPP